MLLTSLLALQEGNGIFRIDVSLLGGVINSMDLLFPFSCSMDNL